MLARLVFFWLSLAFLLATAVSTSAEEAAIQVVEEPNVIFNVENVRTILYYAYSAFCPAAQLEQWDCQWCELVPSFQTVSVVTDNVTDVYGFVGFVVNESDTGSAPNSLLAPRIVASFRGSQDLRNWIVDVDALPMKPYENLTDVKVHPGFYEGYNGIRDAVRNAVLASTLKVCPEGGCDVICTGHSLGAALSAFCAADLAQFSHDYAPLYPSLAKLNVSVINFGQPRTGNPGWADYFNQTVQGNRFRLVNWRDLVPHVPPRDFGYEHFPYEIWELKNGTYLVCNGSGEDPSCSDSLAPDYYPPDHMTYMGVHNNNCGM